MTNIDYGLEKSILYRAASWDAIRESRAGTPDNPRPTDEELWMEEVNQYRCSLQVRTFDYIEEQWGSSLTELPEANSTNARYRHYAP